MTALHAAEQPRTFCNPLPIPNYPVGVFARGVTHGTPDPGTGWLLGYREQYRELADPVVLWHEGKWYLYPSVDMAWVSADNGATWQHQPLNLRDVGYAPTVVSHRGRFLLAANNPAIYASSSPLGPFEKIGDFPAVRSATVPEVWDKMLFSDE